jgi:hypothetical protein
VGTPGPRTRPPDLRRLAQRIHIATADSRPATGSPTPDDGPLRVPRPLTGRLLRRGNSRGGTPDSPRGRSLTPSDCGSRRLSFSGCTFSWPLGTKPLRQAIRTRYTSLLWRRQRIVVSSTVPAAVKILSRGAPSEAVTVR